MYYDRRYIFIFLKSSNFGYIYLYKGYSTDSNTNPKLSQ